MITDAGLDRMGTTLVGQYGSPTMGTFLELFNAAHVGEGSTAPSPADVALVDEVAMTTSFGSLSRSTNSQLGGANDVMRLTESIPRVFSIGDDYNLTEFGFGSTSGPLTVRDLFREDQADPLSNPVVITVQAGDELQLWLEFTVSIPWVDAAPAQLEITDYGLVDGVAGWFWSGVLESNPDRAPWGQVWPGGAQPANRIETMAVAVDPVVDTGRGDPLLVPSGLQGENLNVTPDGAYVSGSFERDYTMTVEGSEAVGSVYAIVIPMAWDGPNNVTGGYRFVFDTPIDKTHLQRFSFTFTKQWGRA